ncbi:MAG: glycosyltransferase family 4 protein [Salaquimonas sp.]|nr:glycosyltransferase family 4 protein [Salaquimonas sp.]
MNGSSSFQQAEPARLEAVQNGGKLRIVHCFRSPVGGIFRHVRDLVGAQRKAGHSVAILCDSTTGGSYEEELFEAIRPELDLGLIRIPMRRAITPGDFVTLYRTFRELRRLKPDVVHGHGAKGGAYARIIGTALRASGSHLVRLYTPHGGSIHFDADSLSGRLYFMLERMMERLTDRLIFVSQYEADGYRAKVGLPRCPQTLAYNGLTPDEYVPVAEAPDAADFLYMGMMRDLKGPDLFLEALAKLGEEGRDVTAQFVGDGPDKDDYLKMIEELGLAGQVSVHEAMSARKAFALARIIVVPSRAESMPYTVLEAIAAQRPIVVTRVGGVPEIFAGDTDNLVEPDNVQALADAMAAILDDKDRENVAKRRREALQKRFSVNRMAEEIEAAYRATLRQ